MTQSGEHGAVGSDAELITRVRAGDRTAYGTLYARHSAAAMNLARQFARSPSEADDLVAESFARVLDALIAERGPDTAFRAYLFTTIRNTAYDRTAKDRRLYLTDDVAAYEVPDMADDPVLMRMESSLIATAFASLPERWQTVLWHTQVEGQTPAETGVLLGMSANAVSSLAFRAREGLREAYLQAHLADTAAERCRATVERLGGWARGGLSRREKAQVDAHLSECDRCRALAAELAEINTSLRGLLAPLLLGGAAAGYLATLGPVGALTQLGALSGAAGSVGVAGAGAASAGGSSGSTSGIGSFFARPRAVAAAAAGVAAVVVATLVIALSASGQQQPPSAAGPAVVTPAGTSLPAPPASAALPPAQLPEASAPATASAAPPAAPVMTSSSVVTTSAVTRSAVPTPELTTQAASTSAPTTRPTTAQAARPPETSSRTTRAPVVAPTSAPPPPTGSPTNPPVATPTSAPTTSTPAATPPTTVPPPTTAAPPAIPPAQLTASTFLVGVGGVIAGGAADVAITIDNAAGSQASSGGRLSLSAPTGATVTGATTTAPAPSASPLRRLSSFVATADNAPTQLACMDGSCALPNIPGGTAVTVTLTVSVAPATADGTMQALIDGKASGAAVPLVVSAGLTRVSLDAATALQAGTSVDVGLSATVADGVVDLGTLTLPLRSPALWITGHPANCRPDSAVPPTSLTCQPDGPVASGPGLVSTVSFGTLSITVLPSGVGAQHLTAALPGGRSAPVVYATGDPITITPLSPGSPVTLSGPFGGTVIGAEALACAKPFVTRGNCDGLTEVQHPQPVIIPQRSTIIWASLTWAVTAPADGDPKSLDSIVFHTADPGGDPARSDVAHPIGPAGVSTPVADTDGQMYVRSVDVTDLVTPDGQVWVSGIAATKVTTRATPKTAGTTPMAGWALSLIWSDPSADATVESSNPGTRNVSSKEVSTTTLATAGLPIIDMSTVVWAADPWGNKHIVVNDKAAEPAPPPIQGVRTIDGKRYYATGVDVVVGVKARANQDIRLTNADQLIQPPWRRDGDESYQDGLWIGPTVVVRSLTDP